MTAPSVTIVTPSLNQGAFIERTIRSVLDQGYDELEYIIVDGGSTDDTIDVIRAYEDRIAFWVSESDNGQAHAIMKGIARSTGTLVAYINSDDYYLPGAIRALAEPFAADASTSWSAGTCRYLSEDGEEDLWATRLPVGPKRRWIDETWYVPQASSLWHRRVFDRLGGLREDLHYIFDSEFALRLALNGVLPAVIDQVVAVRYLHDDAKSAQPELFAREWSGVQQQMLGDLGLWDRVEDFAYRVKRRVKRSGGATAH